jgi:hypothetical protein
VKNQPIIKILLKKTQKIKAFPVLRMIVKQVVNWENAQIKEFKTEKEDLCKILKEENKLKSSNLSKFFVTKLS